MRVSNQPGPKRSEQRTQAARMAFYRALSLQPTAGFPDHGEQAAHAGDVVDVRATTGGVFHLFPVLCATRRQAVLPLESLDTNAILLHRQMD